jgi:hypothetical protein
LSKVSNREKARQLLGDAAFNIDVVERGKSVHNMAYSRELLQSAVAYMEEALQLVGSSYKPERLQPDAKDIPSQCSQCHAGIEEINGQVYGLSFPHKAHVVSQKMECSTCHSNEKRHGEFIGSKKQCAACHHQDTKKDCGSCHVLQKTLYTGGTLDSWEVPKDMMAEANVGCADCHSLEKGRINPADSSTCANCHEESYKKTFAEWQDAYKKQRDSLLASLEGKKRLKLAEEDRAKLAEVAELLKRLENDGSSSVHNSQFVEALLTKLEQKVKSIGEK